MTRTNELKGEWAARFLFSFLSSRSAAQPNLLNLPVTPCGPSSKFQATDPMPKILVDAVSSLARDDRGILDLDLKGEARLALQSILA